MSRAICLENFNPKMAKSSSRRRGFTLVEVMVAITVVNVMVALFGRMFVAHNRLVSTLEEWCIDNPVYFVVPNADPLARSVAAPAALMRDLPVASDVVSGAWDNEVEVAKLERDLNQLISRAYVNVSPDPAGKGKKD